MRRVIVVLSALVLGCCSCTSVDGGKSGSSTVSFTTPEQYSAPRFVSSPTTNANDQVRLVTSTSLPDGWIANGYGAMVYAVTNLSDKTVKFDRNLAQFTVSGKDAPHSWNEPLAMELAPGEAKTGQLVAWMNPKVAALATNAPPHVIGKLTYAADGEQSEIPYELDVPVASLEGPMMQAEGRRIGLNLQARRFEEMEHLEEIVAYLDDTYDAMVDLTGFHPYDGALLVLEESPPHPYWAYAGNPIVLNTKFVPQSVEYFDRGLMSFGWIHEMGHVFDFGGWYIINGPWAEFMANFKVNYSLEQVAPGNEFARIHSWGKDDAGTYQDARHWVDKHFLDHGLPYLADPSRDWTSLGSDDIQSFHLNLVRKYGWDLYRHWFRVYLELGDGDLERPTSPEDKINLNCAVASAVLDEDLVPFFQLWRMPVTAESVAEMNERYPIGDAAAKVAEELES